MTPMMSQYLETKKEYPDHILFYRLGDFYEMFFEDARIASRELDLVLTGKDCGEEQRAPMCGIPFHSAENYITRLVEKGIKVAICEQVEDPATAKGLVKREVVKIVTPGTAVGSNLTNDTKNNYLCAIYMQKNSAACAFCDISENNVKLTFLSDENRQVFLQKLSNEISLFAPSELLLNVPKEHLGSMTEQLFSTFKCAVNDNLDGIFSYDEKSLADQFESLPEFCDDTEKDFCYSAVSAIISYLHTTQLTSLVGIRYINLYKNTNFLAIDSSSRRNLELSQTMRNKEKKGSLLWVLDKTKTAVGARMLRRMLDQPLTNCNDIENRLNAVEEVSSNVMFKDSLRELLSSMQDIERILSKLNYSKASPRDLLALSETLKLLPEIASSLKETKSAELQNIYNTIFGPNGQISQGLAAQIDVSIDPDAPITTREGGVIKRGFNKDVDSLRDILTQTHTYLTSIENTEKELTGIKNLKVSYNRVFGYYIEVSKSFINFVPDRYIRKQTLTNCERYITEELKELEGRILGAKDKIILIENEIFDAIVKTVTDETACLQAISEAIGRLDVYCSLAHVAIKNNYVRPEVDLGDVLELKDSRHPVVEALADNFFVPNDVYLDTSSNRMAIITGPNMAGKSTYMRQVALIVIMAQIGSFVPAKSARIGIVDKIFTRVGASDDLSTGQSTFMLEMNEVAYILKNATKRSLILYDGIGRGPSTYDGMSIARAVVEYTAGKKIGARTLFATHYHELSELENTVDGIKNFNIATKKRGEEIIFLRKIIPGSADDSYGIEVAKLAGVPSEVIKRARIILKELEEMLPQAPIKAQAAQDDPFNVNLFDDNKDKIVDIIKAITPDTLTPIEALGKLYELKKLTENL